TTYFRYCVSGKLRVTWIFSFGRINEKYISSNLTAGRFKYFLQLGVGGAGVGCTFKRDQLPHSQEWSNCLRSPFHKRQIGLSVLAKRRRNAENYNFAVKHLRKIA